MPTLSQNVKSQRQFALRSSSLLHVSALYLLPCHDTQTHAVKSTVQLVHLRPLQTSCHNQAGSQTERPEVETLAGVLLLVAGCTNKQVDSHSSHPIHRLSSTHCKITHKLEIRSVEHGICPIAEFTSPLLNCAAILAIRP